MGTFRTPIELAAAPDEPFEVIDALVDTGATYTLVPSPILKRLGVEPAVSRRFAIADGNSIERDLGVALIRLNGETLPSLVVFGDDNAGALLGAVTLEQFALGVDPVGQRLAPVTSYLVGFWPPEDA